MIARAVRPRARAVEIVGLLADAADDGVDRRAARHRRVVVLQHQRRRALGDDEAVAVLGERPRDFLRRLVGARQRREKREADHHFRVDRAVGAERDRRIGVAAADRLDAELDRGRAGGAGGRQRDRRALGADRLGDALGDEAEQRVVEAVVVVVRPRRRDHAVVGVARPRPARRGRASRGTATPVSAGGIAANSGPGKSPWRADAGVGDRLLARRGCRPAWVMSIAVSPSCQR